MFGKILFFLTGRFIADVLHISYFQSFCNEQSVRLWRKVRDAQIARMIDYRPMPHEPVNQLVAFYSHMMHRLAILCARLQVIQVYFRNISLLSPINLLGFWKIF